MEIIVPADAGNPQTISPAFSNPAFSKTLGLCIFFFLGLEALLSTAPLTGSDAMAYHFTVPLLQIGRPEQPIFWLTTSFYIGLGHELIALGLVLGGDRLALLLIFFGGCLTAAALFQMARKWMPVEWALAAALTFLMTPMVFWQISTAGSPDIWMGFYTVLAALAVGQARRGVHAPLAAPRQRVRRRGSKPEVHGVDCPGRDYSLCVVDDQVHLVGRTVFGRSAGHWRVSVTAKFLVDGRPIFPFPDPLDWKSSAKRIRIGITSKGRPLGRVFHATVSHFVFPGCDDP